MNKKDVLVVEISGKRPGTKKERPTEGYEINYDKLIISNNSTDYDTEWEIVNVPEDYKEWYIQNYKQSDNAWYAPMNRSYAIKYAKEHGYKYLIQLDDNIININIRCKTKNKILYINNKTLKFDDVIDMLITVLENTNAGMAGCDIVSMSVPQSQFLAERFCYSLFALKLDICPPIFHGSFEDDIEYRLKLYQMGIPCVQVVPFKYGKTGQAKNKDLSGCRAEYLKQGVKRGEQMRKLYGDIYSCGMASGAKPGRQGERRNQVLFKHRLKSIKAGVIVYDMDAIKNKFKEIVSKYIKE
jgi:hypothetical protein